MSTNEYIGVSSYRDRHGKTRWRYRRTGVSVSLKGRPGEPEFEHSYKVARDGIRPDRGLRTGTLYVIQGEAGTPIKIGFTNHRTASHRLSALQIGNSAPLRIIAQAPAYHGHEGIVHTALASDHVHGEWFAWTPATREFVDALAAGIGAALLKIFPDGLRG